MIQRVALVVSLVALAAVIGGVVFLSGKLDRLSRQVASLERREPAAQPPAPPPAPPPVAGPEEAKRELERGKMRELAERENREQFDVLAKRLGLEAEVEAKVRDTFNEEFAYYADGVVRALKNIEAGDPGGDENYLTSAPFKKGLEEKIAETDRKAHALLNAFQQSTFDDWRREMRRERYELD